jgi:hypothetical protein
MGTDVRTLKYWDDPIGQICFDTIKGLPKGGVRTEEYCFPESGTPEVTTSSRGVPRDEVELERVTSAAVTRPSPNGVLAPRFDIAGGGTR